MKFLLHTAYNCELLLREEEDPRIINRQRTTSISFVELRDIISDYVATRMEIVLWIVVANWTTLLGARRETESRERDGEIYAGPRVNLWRVLRNAWEQEWPKACERERCDYVARDVKQKIGRRISPVSGIGLGHWRWRRRVACVV